VSRGPGKEILSACPFCGGWATVGEDPSEWSNRDKPRRGYFVECGICSASTAVFRLPSGAVAAWNRRTAPFRAEGIRRLDSVRTSICFQGKPRQEPKPVPPVPGEGF
jgi:hypothetical protein